MSPSVFFHRFFLSLFLAIAGLSSALAQTVTLNNAPCTSASVTYGTGTIAINTVGCGTVLPVAPVISSGAPPATGSVGVAYSHTFAASGTTPITWAVTSGALPTGITLSGATISGTPTAAGAFTFAVTASNGTAPSAVSPTYSVTINVVPPVITSSTSLLAATPGVAYSHTFVANQTIPTGGWSVAAGTGPLPGWATLNPNTGILSGTPATGTADLGTTPFSVIATNTNGPSAAQSVSLTVSAPTAPSITGVPTATGTVGTAYSYAFGATGTAPITWSVTGGTQPTGLTLNPSTGVLSGTPTAAGTYTFAVQAANGTLPNAVAPASGTFSIVIAPLPVGGVTKDTSGADIPVPSKFAGTRPTTHTGTNGAGALYAWAVNPTRCDNTQPAISSSWHHNIDFYQHGVQGQLDNFDMAPNESLTYEFIPTETGPGQVFVGTNGQLPLPANFMSISTKPCDFDLTKLVSGPTRDFCYVTAPVDNQLSWIVTTGAAYFTCKMVPGTKYYLNLRWQDAAPGGANTVDSCAARGLARCGAYLQIRR